jgi:hypothetical protein
VEGGEFYRAWLRDLAACIFCARCSFIPALSEFFLEELDETEKPRHGDASDLPVGQNHPPALHAAVTIVLAPASHWVQNFPAGERQAV